MKNLLVLTDFSEASFHAASYACMLAGHYGGGRVMLYHASANSLQHSGLPGIIPDTNIIPSDPLTRLEQEMERLRPSLGDHVTIEGMTEPASLSGRINSLCEELHADLVVVGVTGGSERGTAPVGSNTVLVSETCKYPVLIVPEKAPLIPVSNILFTCDLEKVKETMPEQKVTELIEKLGAPGLMVLNVDYRNRSFVPDTSAEMRTLHDIFDRYEPAYHYIEHTDAVSGIMAFAAENNASIIITIPKKYGFFEALFRSGTTRKLMYHTTIPLLTLHG